jgi:hypothetical protein
LPLLKTPEGAILASNEPESGECRSRVMEGSMERTSQPKSSDGSPRGQSLRLKFRIAAGEVKLISFERVDMISPRPHAANPEPGKHGGFWIDLRDGGNNVLFYRVLDNPLGDLVEVYSPDGTIKRITGAVNENTFEILVPDDSNTKSIVFWGESLEPGTTRQPTVARELARFDVPEGMRGGAADGPGAQP